MPTVVIAEHGHIRYTLVSVPLCDGHHLLGQDVADGKREIGLDVTVTRNVQLEARPVVVHELGVELVGTEGRKLTGACVKFGALMRDHKAFGLLDGLAALKNRQAQGR